MIAPSEIVTVRKDVPSGSIILNRPDRRNAISTDTLRQIREAFGDLHQERSVRAVILTGTTHVFSSGTDLHELKEGYGDPKLAQAAWQEFVAELQGLIEDMLRFPKPILFALNGWAVGSAVALMLACDLVVAIDRAKIALPETRRGLVAGLAAPLLQFRVGTARAASLLYLNAVVDAAQALNFGLVHQVVEDRLVWFRAQECAKEIAESAPEAIQLTKRLMNETIGEALFTQLSIGAANMAAARTTEAAQEGVTAFLEKRPPNWK
jgi:enoyl-CoA hydratase/carnithine racemase